MLFRSQMIRKNKHNGATATYYLLELRNFRRKRDLETKFKMEYLPNNIQEVNEECEDDKDYSLESSFSFTKSSFYKEKNIFMPRRKTLVTPSEQTELILDKKQENICIKNNAITDRLKAQKMKLTNFILSKNNAISRNVKTTQTTTKPNNGSITPWNKSTKNINMSYNVKKFAALTKGKSLKKGNCLNNCNFQIINRFKCSKRNQRKNNKF